MKKINNFDSKEFENKMNKSNQPVYHDFIHKDKIFTNPGELFNFMIEDEKLLKSFISEIKNIIFSMETILFIPPHPILFGRIDTNNRKFQPRIPIFNPYMKNINKDFYDGFEVKV